MKRKAKSKTSQLPSLTYKAIHWALFCLVLVNLYLVFCFERDRKPVVVRETVTTISNHVWIVTNVLRNVHHSSDVSVPGPTNEFGGIKVNDPNFEIPISYRYFYWGDVKYISLGENRFTVGDDTSYGRIVAIFPERVRLDNGYYLKNSTYEERYGYGSQALSYEERLIRMFPPGSNSSLVVGIEPNTRENYFGGYSSLHPRESKISGGASGKDVKIEKGDK